MATKKQNQINEVLGLLEEAQASIDTAAGIIANLARHAKDETEESTLDDCLRIADGLLDRVKTVRLQIRQALKEIE